MTLSACLVRPVVIVCAAGETVVGGRRGLRLRGEFVLPGGKNGLDIFQGRSGGERQCPLAGILEPLCRIFVSQLQQSQAGFIPLLLDLVAAENGMDSTFRAAANLTGLADKPFPVPLHIFLVVRRHVLLNGAVLVEFAVQPGMGTDPAPIVEYLTVALVKRTSTFWRIYSKGTE